MTNYIKAPFTKLSFFVLLFLISCNTKIDVDLIIHNGNIYSLDENNFNLILADNLCSSAWETISIMSQADYLIISCSTFSWWAAYLSNSFVISPILSLWDTRLKTLDNWI